MADCGSALPRRLPLTRRDPRIEVCDTFNHLLSSHTSLVVAGMSSQLLIQGRINVTAEVVVAEPQPSEHTEDAVNDSSQANNTGGTTSAA